MICILHIPYIASSMLSSSSNGGTHHIGDTKLITRIPHPSALLFPSPSSYLRICLPRVSGLSHSITISLRLLASHTILPLPYGVQLDSSPTPQAVGHPRLRTPRAKLSRDTLLPTVGRIEMLKARLPLLSSAVNCSTKADSISHNYP